MDEMYPTVDEMQLGVTEMHLRSSDSQVFNPSFLGYREIREVEDAAELKNVFQTFCNTETKTGFPYCAVIMFLMIGKAIVY